jgi:hypothetical protein
LNQPSQRPLASSWLGKFTFPNRKHAPSRRSECSYIPSIALFVAFELRFPEFTPSPRNASFLAVVSMPKTPLDEDSCVVLWQNQVWPSREIFSVQAEAKSSGVQEAANPKLRVRVLAPYA